MTKNEVIETIRTWIQTTDDEYDIEEQGRVYGLMEALELVKQIEPEQKWIPVSEESLPKEDNEVLITIKSCGNWYVCHSVYRDGQFWQKNFEYHSYRKPIAWQPLPEPYKEKSEG